MLCHIISSGFGLSHDLLLQVLGQSDGGPDVGGLTGFVAANQQDDDPLSSSRKVHALPRAVVDAQFRYALPHWFGITEIARHDTFDANEDTRPRSDVAQPVEPAYKLFSLSNLEHPLSVSIWLHRVKTPEEARADLTSLTNKAKPFKNGTVLLRYRPARRG